MKKKVFLIIAIVVLVMGATYMLLPSSTLTTISGIMQKVNQTGSGTWDISANGDGSVRAVLSEDGTTLIISGTGAMKDFDSSTREWNKVSTVVIEEGVTNIGNYAFYGCSSLSSITISEAVTVIGNRAFYNCSSLSSIEIPEGVTSIGSSAFYGCNSLISITVAENNAKYSSMGGVLFNKEQTQLIKYPAAKEGESYVIPEGVTSIASSAFYGCSSLSSIEIPEGVNIIADSAFYNCSSLSSITIPEGLTHIGDSTFERCSSLVSIGIPTSVTYIGDSAFYGCSSLSSIEIPEEVTRIGEYTFYNCSSLSSITIPEKVTIIYSSAFGLCNNLSSIEVNENNVSFSSIGGVLFNEEQTELIKYPAAKEGESYVIPEGVEKIASYAFDSCISLSSITIPEEVTDIGKCSFYGCSSLSSITIPKGVTSIGSRAFYNCSSLSSIEIPEGVTSIGEYTFYNCSSLSSIEIPANVTSIGSFAFDGCSSLSSITIPEGVTNIGNYAFYECSSLSSINIPEGITSLGSDVLTGCTNLSSIEVDENNANYSSIYGVLFNKEQTQLIKYPSARTNESYIIPSSVVTIKSDAFAACQYLSNITIASEVSSTLELNECINLKNIEVDENNAKYSSLDGVLFNKGQTQLIKYPSAKEGESYVIPEGITTIDSRAFSKCINLESIEVDENNVSFSSIDGVLFNKGQTRLIKYPSAKEGESYVIPKGVSSIGSYAFSGCSRLTDIEISEGVTSISSLAFYGCDSLEKVIIDSKVRNLGSAMFSECPAITKLVCADLDTDIENIFYNEIPENLTIYALNGSKIINEAIEKGISYKELNTLEVKADDNSIESNSIDMKIGDSKQVSVYATTEESDVSLEVSEIFTAYVENEEIATLDETGTMTAIKAGQTRLLVNNSSEYAASYPEAITINVEKLDPEYTAPTGLTATYGQTLADVELPEGFIWEDSTTSVGNVGENTFTVTYTPQDTENYKTVTGIEVQVTVGKATYDMSNVIFEDTPYTYDGTEKSIVISGTLPEGVEVRYENNTGIVAGEYSATAIFVGDAVNYNTIENKTAKLIIEKANPTVTAPAGLTATYGQTLSDVELPEGFSWESDRATSVGNVGENTFTVTYTPQDTVNYNTITGMEVKITVMSSLNIDLGEYVVAEENETKYIQGISPETTLGTLKSEITTNGEIQVYNGETPITEEDAKIATGMEIRIVLNGEQVSYKAVVKGDITGDGSADISDLVLLARYVAGTDKNVEVIKIKAMEVNNNDNANKVDMSDLVIMARYVAKTIDKI